MGPGQGKIACDRVLIDLHQTAGGPGPTALPEVVQDVADLLLGQAGLLQDGALTFGGAGLAGATVDHANALALTTVTSEGEISLAPAARIGTVGILATEMLDGWHVDPP